MDEVGTAMSDPSTSSMPVLGYEGEPHGAAYQRWRDEFGRRIMAVDFVPLAPGPLRREITPALLPRMNLSCSTGTPMKFVSTGANNELVLVMSLGSPLHVQMGKRAIDLGAGGVSLGDASINGAFVAQLSPGDFKSLLIDRDTLLRVCPDAEASIGTALMRDPTLTALLQNYYVNVAQHAGGLDAVARDAVSRHMLDLVVLMLGAHRDEVEQARSRGLAAARMDSIKAQILDRLGDGALSVTQIARSQRVTPRYIQLLFEREGTSFSEFVLERRLAQVARLLQDPRQRDRRISELAYRCGFNDLSHFNHSFRRRYGMTPTDMRVEAGMRGD